MILKTAANYNDEGGYIEAWKKSDGTTEVKLIPKSGGGGDDGKNGIKSISISPAITTTPELDSLFPIYWDDLTDEEKQNGVSYSLNASNEPADGTQVTITVTPTSDWYAYNPDTETAGEKGQPMSSTLRYTPGFLSHVMPMVVSEPTSFDELEKYIMCTLKFTFS